MRYTGKISICKYQLNTQWVTGNPRLQEIVEKAVYYTCTLVVPLQ